MCFFILNDPSQIHNDFLQPPAAAVTVTINTSRQRCVWFLAPLKRPFSFQAVCIICNAPIQWLQPQFGLQLYRILYVFLYHSCKLAKFVSLFIYLPLPYGTGIKCTSEHFRAPLLFIVPLKVICSLNLLVWEVFESFWRRACHKKWLKKPPNENLGGVCVDLNHWVHCNVTGKPHSFHIGKVACCVKLWPTIELCGDI